MRSVRPALFSPALVLGLFCLPTTTATPTTTHPREAAPALRAVFKGQVDATVRALRQSMRSNGSLADGTALQTARALTAMGHCHRFYSRADGPIVQRPMQFLFESRRGDGSFAGDVATTGWVLEALDVLNDKPITEVVGSARRWLKEQGATTAASPFSALVAEVAQAATGGVQPAEFGAEAAREAPQAAAAGQWTQALDSLLQLVACQVVARRIDEGKAPDGTAKVSFDETRQHALDYLLQQQEDGTFYVQTDQGRFPDLGITALALAAVQTKPTELRDETERAVVEKGLASLLAAQNEDGSFGQRSINYTTCAVIQALAKSDDEAMRKPMIAAREYVLRLQNSEDRGYASSDRDYGSIGYGGDERGDLSNLQFAIDALRKSGLDADHEAFAKALVFMRRTQNLESANDFKGRVRDEEGEWHTVASGDDGGAAYYPGNSPAGYVELPDGTHVPRSYGSMTYALLKAYILCGLEGDDPRVSAAVGWIRDHWTLQENPGVDPRLPEKARYQGLFYYYMVLAQALAAADISTIQTAHEVVGEEGTVMRTTAVDWREELATHLASMQADDGSFVNSRNGRWYESQPVLCTVYALLALELCAE